ncbi:MAG TPA: type II secretion system minor pseudopilin GspK [Planctomycetota bacterium]|nr:type II secretion system minor pseudopilin GspK [Planctomycetota bacterium]
MKGMRRRRTRGVALLLALLVLTILILIVGQMAVSGAHNRSISRNATASLQNEYGVLGGYRQALVRILADRDRNPDVDTLEDVWNPAFAFPLGAAQVSGRIVDCERRFNLSALVNNEGEIVPEAKAQLVRLIQNLGHEPTENAERIADYVDADTKGSFEAGARNARLLNLQELQRIEGLAREVLFGEGQRRGLLPYLTVWPKDGQLKINPNTAPLEVLQSLDEEMTQERAQAILTYRDGAGDDGQKRVFKTVEDVRQVQQLPNDLVNRISGRLAFKAAAFEIRVVSTTYNVSRKELYAVRWKGAGAGQEGGEAESKLELIGSMREHDYFDLKPDE